MVLRNCFGTSWAQNYQPITPNKFDVMSAIVHGKNPFPLHIYQDNWMKLFDIIGHYFTFLEYCKNKYSPKGNPVLSIVFRGRPTQCPEYKS
jgi:hypothetical protein